jgi:hypothetical protein
MPYSTLITLPNLHIASPLAIQNWKKKKNKQKKKNKLKNNKINYSFVGFKIEFSVCNKHFKTLGLPSGRVKSCEGLPKMIPINIIQDHVIHKIEVSQKQ